MHSVPIVTSCALHKYVYLLYNKYIYYTTPTLLSKNTDDGTKLPRRTEPRKCPDSDSWFIHHMTLENLIICSNFSIELKQNLLDRMANR